MMNLENMLSGKEKRNYRVISPNLKTSESTKIGKSGSKGFTLYRILDKNVVAKMISEPENNYISSSESSLLSFPKSISDVVNIYNNEDAPKINRKTTFNHALKRGMDIVLSTAGLIVTAPAIVTMAIATRYDSGSPSLFEQKRVGYNGEVFTIKKIRVMHNGSEEKIKNGEIESERAYVNVSHESPVYTRLGRIFDKWHVNELPQFISVIKGDMSIVGPRPLPTFVAEKYLNNPKYARKYSNSLQCKPGLVSYTTIRDEHDITDRENIELRLQYSNNYTNGFNILEDISIIGQTIKKYWSDFRRTSDKSVGSYDKQAKIFDINSSSSNLKA